MQFTRNDIALGRGTFRVRGDVLEIQPKDEETITRVEFFGDEVEKISVISYVTGEVYSNHHAITVYPASHFVTPVEKMESALEAIEVELEERVKFFEKQGRYLEAQRIEQRTRFDMEMMRELGYCSGIENYSRVLDGRPPGSTPHTLVEYFPEDFLLFIDESHQTIPQLHGMHAGDRSRKETLVEYGFRLPSALDNRPLRFAEFEKLINQAVFVSATPGPYELKHSDRVVEQLIRPTGLLDPQVEVRRTAGQIDDLIDEIKKRADCSERVLVTTLTKRMAEALSEYLQELGLKVNYLHSEIKTIERTEILRDLRMGVHDVVVGINLLREGLDLPEVSLVAILDADKEGFLRDERSLMQTIGRAARNVSGKVIMYADNVTDSMQPRHRRDQPPPGSPARIQRRARDHAHDHRQGHPRSDRIGQGYGRESDRWCQGGGHRNAVPRRSAFDDIRDGARDETLGEGPRLRTRRRTPRRNRRAQEVAARFELAEVGEVRSLESRVLVFDAMGLWPRVATLLRERLIARTC